MKFQKSKLALYLFNLASVIAFIFLLVYSLTSKKAMYNLFVYSSYYLISVILIIWVVQATLLIKTLNFSIKTFLRKYWSGLLISLILTVLVFISVGAKFKTLSDETNLLSVSMSMLNDKTCYNSTMGKYYYDNFNSINNEIEKRPLVFPYMVQIVHTLVGFRGQNAFVLNFIVMFLLLSGIYVAVRQFSDSASAVAALFFMLAYPVLTIFGTSGGFDLLNSAFFILILAAAYYLIKNPSSLAFSFLFASLLVFSNIRYESIAFLVILPLLLFKRVKWHYFKDYSYIFFITPLVSLLYLWQRLLKPDSYQNPENVPVFSIASFFKNIMIFFKSLVDFKYFLPYAGLLSIVSILIFIYLIIEVLRKKNRLTGSQYYSIFVLAASVLISTGIYFCHFFGDCTHPSSARFFITLSIVLALGPVALKICKPKLISGTSLLIISIVCFLFYHPIAVEGRFINALKGNRTTYHCINFLSQIKDKNILTISERPGQFTALGYGAVNFSYANQHSDKTIKEFTRHLFSKIIAFQEIKYQDQAPTKETALNQDYNLNTLYEIQITATEFLRISEVRIGDTQ
ncbi:MAG: glycosyltransferase family 39 protein, partial [Endomicrobiales bacterium]|nr:glycosyltransferase family 39 protein [Endomicrobiales bacterium]